MDRPPPTTGTLAPEEILAFAVELAEAARPIAQAYFRTPLDIVTKADASPVTLADRAIEARLRGLIEARFPDHGVFGEEMGVKPGKSPDTGPVWVIDPIDGTKSFVTGLPLFGTLIAFLDGGAPVVGLIDMPALGERWTGVPGEARFGAEPARTSACRSLSQARFFTTAPDGFVGADAARYRRLVAQTALRRFGGDCYAYGLLASGHCDLIAETGLQPYDIMALVPVIRAAGGIITDWNGEDLGLHSDGRVLAAATPELHAEALAVLQG
ncbi:MAG TPA: histidinol-phosphatase [Methylobacterium sp.]|jgi:histidinol phosphatase-like enzyme (inositol monophosphatase family)|uniref:histidinol-phosphatase n=1 Tax=Methylorubrum sp. B1-46 TaxID=2897334 RepID=UPI001E4275B2|nr:histidinol-phosphatase [Methylorubrum sp. B1-46]UGB24950.1 histidinol-phosphatase [Methylorubrum sp. B1-46]HEV2545133.1 histidinol-phosphatase [Methylobacterium sp.]